MSAKNHRLAAATAASPASLTMPSPTPAQRRVLSRMAATGHAIAADPARVGYLTLGPGSPVVPKGTFNALRAAGWSTARWLDGKARYVLSAAGERVERESRE